MSNLIQLNRGSKSYATRHLFREASFSVNLGEHVGVIGPNGAGKTTLFRILSGQEALDDGELIQSKGLRVGYLAQHDHWKEGQTVEDYLTDGCLTPIWDLKALGQGLGLKESDYQRPIESLSGGYRMRCKLLHLLGEEPDLLLLDEPTNYLDLESLIVLERFLQGYSGAFLLISHDREFLRRTTDHILEVEAGDITKYNGSLDDYFEQKALLRSQLEARALSIEEKKKEVLAFVARFGAKASKASQAQSRLKSLDRMEAIEIKDLPSRAVIRLPEPVRTGKQILQLDGVDLGYGSRTVLKGITFHLNRGDHLAVVGVNGAGKSTFLKALAGELAPLLGTLQYGYGATIGYYAQHVAEVLNPEHTVREAMSLKAHPSVLPQEVLNLAGALLFQGDAVKKPIRVLSGGERSRVALGQILLQKAPCLLLDEPTNHLDFDTVESLTVALSQYPGTVVVVSHDRSFTRRIGKKILEIRDGQVEFYLGSYDEYVWSCQKGVLSTRKPHVSETRSESVKSEKKSNNWEKKKELESRQKKILREMNDITEKLGWFQNRMEFLNQKLLNEPESAESGEWVAELGDLQKSVDEAEEKWLAHAETKEKLDQEIGEMA